MNPSNILFLMDDEHRADVTGFAGNPVIRTPFLDELARTGVVFRNAYTPSPICVPMRQCLSVGQLPSTCGVESYGQDLEPFAMTFPRQLSRHGYQTICAGKLHHMGEDQMQGWTQRVGDNCQVHRKSARKPISGKWSQAKEVLRAGVGHGSDTQDVDAYALEGALLAMRKHFLDPFYDRADPDEPLLLKLSFNRPHYPYFTDEERFSYYLNRVEPYLDESLFDHPFLGRGDRVVRIGTDVTERDVRRATAAYYGMIDSVDHDFGLLAHGLEAAGQNLDDWWIVFTSDHGEMLGQHGIWEKQVFFEGSARVPLVIRPPRALRESWRCEGRVVEENVNLCDLFATLCDASDTPLPEKEATYRGRGLDSRSLQPLMRGETSEWHEHFHNETISQFWGTNLMIKRDALKYHCYTSEECRSQPEILFDLEADPGETRNLIAEPQYAESLLAFRARRDELGFGS